MSYSEIGVVEVAELLRDIHGKPLGSCLLIGAGVSKSAGIGLAVDFVDKIRSQHPAAYKRAQALCVDGKQPNYGQCMGMLTAAQQTMLVRASIQAAKVNWAHIGIALLEANHFVDAILTTNFDPLASRACALFNRFPAIYDLAGLRDSEGGGGLQFDRSFVSGSAIYHLHGQHTGFLLLNTDEKLRAQADRVAPVLNATMIGKPVIVCGYSGENDPLVEKIALLGPFPYGLVWVCHDEVLPGSYVCESLLDRFESCYIVRSSPADAFFDSLFRALKIDPPLFLDKPFDHMLNVLGTISSLDLGRSEFPDLVIAARDRLVFARDAERKETPERQKISSLMAEGRYEDVLSELGDNVTAAGLPSDVKEMVAWAYIMLGNDCLDNSRNKGTDEALEKVDAAIKLYESALSVEPKLAAASNSLGNALKIRAPMIKEDISGPTWKRAEQSIRHAIELQPKYIYAWTNLGYLFFEQAMMLRSDQSPVLLRKSIEIFEKALSIDSESAAALTCMAGSLIGLYPYEEPGKREALLSDAKRYCEAAEANQPGSASYNSACLYARLGDVDRVQEWLTAAKASNELLDCKRIWADPDFEEFVEEDWFRTLMERIGCAQ